MGTDPLDVLVVDDDFRVAEIHAAVVGRVPGYRVVGKAHTAADALSMVRSLRPDLVLMDIFLPDGNGLDVLRSLLDETDPPDVMVISAAQEIAGVRLAMQLGAIHYFIKPFDFGLLVERLTAYQRLRRHMAGLDDEPKQADVDELFRMLRSGPGGPRAARGQSAVTLELVRETVRASATDVSAAEVAETVGISRTTAQRYLNHLEQDGLVKLRLKYGTAGRPEHRYHVPGR